MRGFRLRHWLHLLWFAVLIHVFYLGLMLVGAGSLLTKKSLEVVLTAMNLDGAAKLLTPSVMDMALEQVVAYSVESQRQNEQIQRALATERQQPMPEAYRHFKGRGLLSEDEVFDISAIEAQIQGMQTEVIPESIELPLEEPQDSKKE